MSTPGQSNHPGDRQQQYPSGSGEPGDPFAAGPPGYPGQGSQTGNPGNLGQQGGYPSSPGGYPSQQGGYPGPQPGYSGQPPYPSGPAGYPGSYPGGAGLPPEPPRPNTVSLAFWCWILTTVAALVGLIFTLTSPVWDDAINAGIRQSGSNVSFDVNSLVATIKVTSVVVFLIFAGVFLLFAFKMYAGRNWARIVLTVFGGLSVVSAVMPNTSSVNVNGQTFQPNSGPGWVTVVLAVVGIVLMYLPLSNKYFADSKARRRQLRG